MAKITMIGTGYIGLVTGTLFADRGNDVICVDKNPEVLKILNSGKVHIHEPGLENLVQKNIEKNNLSFTNNIDEAVDSSDVIFIGVNTPSNKDGSFNLDYFLRAVDDVGDAMNKSSGYKIVVGKSTVPQGTYKIVIDRINSKITNPDLKWNYVSNPETLAEGSAVRDFAKPDRIMIGTDSDEAFEKMTELYHPFNIKNDRIIRGKPQDAELAKLGSNLVLASRVAVINELSNIVGVTEGADMDLVRKMITSDTRIGEKFSFPGPGYGGSCFPKDIQGIVHQAELDGYESTLINKIHSSNEKHKNYVGNLILDNIVDKSTPKIGVWGLTFKPRTDDMRDAASIPILKILRDYGAEITAYDPQDEKAREVFGKDVRFVDDQYEAAKNMDALILMTEWSEFDSPDFAYLKKIMKGHQLFDLRNRWLPKQANDNGFSYVGIGRKYLL